MKITEMVNIIDKVLILTLTIHVIIIRNKISKIKTEIALIQLMKFFENKQKELKNKQKEL